MRLTECPSCGIPTAIMPGEDREPDDAMCERCWRAKQRGCSRCLDSPAVFLVSQSDGSGPEMAVCYQCAREAIKPKYPNLKIERLNSEKENRKVT